MLTSGKGKTHEKKKKLEAQVWTKISSEIRFKFQDFFLPFSQVWFISFRLNCIR